MWRCVNNHVFGYCNGEPDWETPPVEITNKLGDTKISGGVCKNNPEQCMKFRYLSEMVDISTLPEPHLVETFTLPELGNEKAKPKSRKARELEAEIAQRSLFE